MSLFDKIFDAPARPLCWFEGHVWMPVNDGPIRWRCHWCSAESRD